MIQARSCATFEKIDKDTQVTYEGMCTEAVHKYEKIFNSN